MFAASHLLCSLPWWIHCPLACSVARELQSSFHLCGGRFSFVDWTTKSSFIRRLANFGNVSLFSSTGRGNKHLFIAYPSTLKNCRTVFWNNSCTFYNYLKRSAQLSPSPRSRNRLCRRTATSIHSCLIFQKTPFIVRGNNAQDCFRYSLAKSSTGCIKLQRGRSCE